MMINLETAKDAKEELSFSDALREACDELIGKRVKEETTKESERFPPYQHILEDVVRTAETTDEVVNREESIEVISAYEENEFSTYEVEVCADVADVLLNSDLVFEAEQQGLYLLSLLPINGKGRGLHSAILSRMLPSRRLVYDLLIPNYVEKSKSYEAGRRSKMWSYKKKPKSLATYQITEPKLLKKLSTRREDQDERASTQTEHGSGTEWLLSSIDRLSSGYVSDELMCREGLVLDTEIKPKVSSLTGRIWHPFTQLPSKIRQNYMLDGEDVAEVDMAKSQLAVISKFWMHDEEERDRLRGHILDGTIYSRLEFVMERDREKIDAWNDRNPKDPIQTTKSLMAKMLMGFQVSDWQTHKFLETEFPSMMRSIAGYKWKVQDSTSQKEALSRFASKLQGEEAYILAQVAERCSELSIPAVPIFDGVLVPRSKAETVRDFFVEVLNERLGFAPEPSIDTTADERALALAI